MNRHPRRAAAAALAAVAALALPACGSSSHSGSAGTTDSSAASSAGPTIAPPAKVTGSISGPGVTSSTITIGVIATTTGPVPGLFQGAFDGLDAWAAYINANGGIAGHTVKVVRADDGFSCNTYTNTMRQYSSQVFAVVGTFTLEDTCGKSVLAAHPQMIDVQGTALDPTLYNVANVYTPTPAPPGFQTSGYEYFKSRFPADITHTATLIGSPALANGKEQMATAESLGYRYVYQRVIGPFETNYTSDILRMKSDGVKIVDMGAVAVNNVAAFLQQAAQQNFHPDAVISAAAYDAQLLKLVGNKSLADNVLFAPLPYPMYLGTDRASVPAVNTFLTWLDKTHPGDSATIYSVSAWAAGMLLLQGIQGAGASVTQASTLKALAGVHDFNAGGLVAPTDPGNRVGSHCVLVAGVTNGHWVRVHPATGYDCNGVFHPVPLDQLK